MIVTRTLVCMLTALYIYVYFIGIFLLSNNLMFFKFFLLRNVLACQMAQMF